MQHAFQQALIDLDVTDARKLWAFVTPHLPQPDDTGMLVMMHRARTQASSMPLRLRAYSHRWLLDAGYPSGLPDELKPSAERIYPQVVEGVGISVNAKSGLFKPIVQHVEQAMIDAVNDAYADGRTDPEFIKSRLHDARVNTVRKLLGVQLNG
jgi:hypothetical protein